MSKVFKNCIIVTAMVCMVSLFSLATSASAVLDCGLSVNGAQNTNVALHVNEQVNFVGTGSDRVQ